MLNVNNGVSNYMDNYALKQQLVGELKEIIRIKQLNLELLDALESTSLFILQESKKGDVPINMKRLQSLIRRVKVLYDELYALPTKHKQPNTTPEDSTES